MERSTSKTLLDSQSEDNGCDGDKGLKEELIISFGNLGLSKNGTLICLPKVTQSKSNDPSVQEGATGDETQKLAMCQTDECPSSQGIQIDELPAANLDMERPCVRENPNGSDTQKLAVARVSMEEPPSSSFQGINGTYELPENLDVGWSSTSLFHQGQRGIWEQPNFNTRGMTVADNHHFGQERSPRSFNTTYRDNGLNPEVANLYGSLMGQTHAGVHSPIQNPAAPSWNYQSDVYNSGNHMMNGFGNFNSVMGSQFGYNELSQIRNGGFYLNNNNNASSSWFMEQQNSSLQLGNSILEMARTSDGSKLLQKYLERGNHELTKMILDGLLDSIFHLMIDEYGHHVLGVLFEKCHINLLSPIIDKASRESDIFISIAFIDKGSRLIQRLIKRLKKNQMAETITFILSTRSYQLLTHKTGTHVIRQCFVTFGEKPNTVLHEAISNDLLRLAIDPVGCISLNICIDSVTGTRRKMFLEYLAAHSRFLSSDPSGNFVVQHMLDLDNVSITEEILHQLQGSFEQLAQKQGGSHVVEKCMRASARGLNLVVKEILKDEKTLCRLAQDMFGNYVVQTALKETMVNDKSLYQALVNALRPRYSHLVVRTTGKYVAARIRAEDLKM